MTDNLTITPERHQKLTHVIANRQTGLTVVLENIHDPHNISAILRSCDAVGIGEVYVVNNTKARQRLGKRSSASARKWVKVNYFEDAAECVHTLKDKGFQVWATHLSHEAVSLYELNLAQPAALVFGNEQDGVSEQILAHCDGNFIIPMVGMIPSLNVSVACAVSLYEAYRQRSAAGLYAQAQMAGAEAEALYQRWTKR